MTAAETTLAGAREALRSPAGEPPRRIAELERSLLDLGETLRGSLSDPGREAPAALADRLELLFEVSELRADVRERALFERLDVLARMQESLAQLRDCEAPEDLIAAAPRELCRSCGFTRALISRVDGSRWIPQVIETVPGMDPDEATFAEYIVQTEIPLEHMLLETELVRRRMPALVTDPANDPRVADVVLRGRSVSYVAAPIMPTGRVIGFLHADRIGQEHPVSADDRDNLWAFAEQFGSLYERAVLLERLHAQREQMREAFADAEGAIGELWQAEIELTRAEREAPEATRAAAAALFSSSTSRLDNLVTRREREVLELMTSGATNTRIAEQLVISEGTVKSHVKHILRKLRAANRAEAVARYLRIVMRDQEDAERR